MRVVELLLDEISYDDLDIRYDTLNLSQTALGSLARRIDRFLQPVIALRAF